MHHKLLLLSALVGYAFGADPIVECVAPRSPERGQAFVQSNGRVVKYLCDPGYVLVGRETVRCLDGEWEDDAPLCVERLTGSVAEAKDPDPTLTPARGLFDWGDQQDDDNETAPGTMQADQSRVRTVLIPGRRAQLRRSSTDGVQVVSLQAPPPVLYVRRTGKSIDRDRPQPAVRRVALHSAAESTPVQVVQFPRAAATQNDKGEDNLRHMYWMAAANYYRQPSYADGAAYLTDSQISWIYSLPPDLRDRYLRDLHVLRADEAAEGERAHAFLRRYGDSYHHYHWRHTLPADPVTLYDYSCNQAGSAFVRAPRLPDAHVTRYDRRQNPAHPRNHYLTAVYACNPGYGLLDERFAELHCSGRRWVGQEPVCVPRA